MPRPNQIVAQRPGSLYVADHVYKSLEIDPPTAIHCHLRFVRYAILPTDGSATF
jgi:hypothetical protein